MSLKVLKFLKSFLYYLTLVLLILSIIFVRRGQIQGASMMPNYVDKENYIYLNKININNYSFPKLNRFDVVIISHPQFDYIIKRVIALPGEEIAYKDNTLFINGNVVEQTFDFIPDNTILEKTIVLPNHIFVMGDNRPNSTDSRSAIVSQVALDSVIGISMNKKNK